MKKLKKILFCSLLACSIFAFTACTAPETYLITASSSDSSWGRITGAETEAMDQGSKITLGVIENNENEHPFICWIKDYTKLYSTEKDIQLVYDEDTQGHYTALFNENPSAMRFATLSSVNLEASDYTQCSYSLNYSSNKSGSNNYSTFLQGEFDKNQVETDRSSIFYFGSLGETIEFKFEINLEITNAQNEVNNVNLKFNTKLNTSSFNQTTYSELISFDEFSNTKVTLRFEKLSYNMYHTEDQ